MGGRGYDIRMRPDNPDIMYVTEQFTGIHKSIDGGYTWFPINEGIDARAGSSGDGIPTFCLTIDPNNYDIIWAGTLGYRGVYRSADGGNTWEKRTNGIVENMDLTLRGFAIEPGNSNVVYAAGDVNLGKRCWYDATKGVVYKTTDAGLHWEAIWRGDNLARYVLIDPTDVNTLYMSTGLWDREAANSDLAANVPGGVGILKSTDGGTTWRTINNGLENLYVGSLAMHPTNPKILLAGVGFGFWRIGNGVYLTTDGGEHWTHVLETGDATTSTPVTSVEFSTKDPNVVWAGGVGFWRSTDGGWNWTRFEGQSMGFWGPPGFRLGNPIDFQADPRNVLRLFTNNYDGGNVLSEDGGQTWIESSTGYTGATVNALTVVPGNSSVVFASGKNGPAITEDAGALWRGINVVTNAFPVPGAYRMAIDPTDPRHLLMAEGKDARVYESYDGGSRWTMIIDYRDELWARHGDGAAEGMVAIAYAPSQPRKVYGGFAWSICGQHWPEGMNKAPIVSFLTSEDGGHTWTRRTGTALDGFSVEDIVVHPTNADIAWAATGSGGVFRTTDGGATWQAASNGLTTLVETSLALDPHNPNVLYAGSVRAGVFKTDDGGATWRLLTAGINPNENIISVVIDPVRPNVVYAGSEFSGVYVSEDAGATWSPLNRGLRTRAVHALAISADGMVLYAGTDGEGVFRLGDVTAPAVLGAAPVAGSIAGGTTVTITGTGFVGGATTVTFGGTAGSDVNVASSASLTVVTPPHAAGSVAVMVTTPNGSGSQSNAFMYVAPPGVSATPSALRFGASKAGANGDLIAVTGAQTVTVGFTGASSAWTASASQLWVQLKNASGTGAGQFTVEIINPGNVLGGATSLTATVTITPTTAGLTATTVSVALTIDQTNGSATAGPFGQIDTPAQNASGVVGAIGVSGWALDDVGVASVKIYRNCLAFENQQNCQMIGGNNVVYVGDAAFVAGARPDVEAAFPDYPQAYRAGWGHLLLTNMLPHVTNHLMYGGQGTLTFYAFATDVEGNVTLLGRQAIPPDHTPTTITLANDTLAKPFGAIDTPSQGQTVRGILPNFGWALTPDDGTGIEIPTNGSTMAVFIDGVAVANVSYNQCRGDVGNPVHAGLYCNDDVASIFGNATPQATFTTRTTNPTMYRNLDIGRGAIGAYVFDTTTLANGVHTIAWGVTDSAGRPEGIGSRFFTVLNSSSDTSATGNPVVRLSARRDQGAGIRGSAPRPPIPDPHGANAGEHPYRPAGAVRARTGFDLQTPYDEIETNGAGIRRVQIPELGRLELYLGPVDIGYLVANGTLRDLPEGSHLDTTTGLFTWMPGPGYLGTYRLTFVRAGRQVQVEVTVGPPTGGTDRERPKVK